MESGRKFTFSVSILILFGTSLCGQITEEYKWPDGKKAAVCLTYDDALDCHLDIVVPALDSFDIKATFFLTGSSLVVANRIEDWRSIAKNGHELGNHSLFHPCRKYIEGIRDADWVRPEYDLDTYTFSQLLAELRTANSLLSAIDGQSQRTFAYPCVDHTIRGIEISDSIQNQFIAARAGSSVPESMVGINPYLMPSTSSSDLSGQELIDIVKQAQKNGTIATIFFHSVGGGYLNVSTEAHMELLAYLSDNEDELWVDTFRNVTTHIKNKSQK